MSASPFYRILKHLPCLCIVNTQWALLGLNELDVQYLLTKHTKPSWGCSAIQLIKQEASAVLLVTWKTSSSCTVSWPQGKLPWPCFPLQLPERIEPLLSGSLPVGNVSSWQPGASPQLCLLRWKGSPAVPRSLGLSSFLFRWQTPENMFSSDKKKQLNMLIKALWFSCFFKCITKQITFCWPEDWPGSAWPRLRCGLTARTLWDVKADFTVKSRTFAAAPPAGYQMLLGNCVRTLHTISQFTQIKRVITY